MTVPCGLISASVTLFEGSGQVFPEIVAGRVMLDGSRVQVGHLGSGFGVHEIRPTLLVLHDLQFPFERRVEVVLDVVVRPPRKELRDF